MAGGRPGSNNLGGRRFELHCSRGGAGAGGSQQSARLADVPIWVDSGRNLGRSLPGKTSAKGKMRANTKRERRWDRPVSVGDSAAVLNANGRLGSCRTGRRGKTPREKISLGFRWRPRALNDNRRLCYSKSTFCEMPDPRVERECRFSSVEFGLSAALEPVQQGSCHSTAKSRAPARLDQAQTLGRCRGIRCLIGRRSRLNRGRRRFFCIQRHVHVRLLQFVGSVFCASVHVLGCLQWTCFAPNF